MGGDYIADYSAIKASSERDVVLHVVELAGRLLRRRRGFLGGLGASEGLGARLACPRARAEHLHGVGNDLRGIAILAFLVLPLPRPDASFDVYLRVLLKLIAFDLRLPAE